MSSSCAPKKILNNPEEAVDEFVEGLLLQYPHTLVKLADHHVLLSRAALSSSHVQLISGGGSGHEPSHAGWVGPGMLSGAVLGGMFASPSVAAVLAAIRALSSSKGGTLLIVKNYTGDRLNFGMACEQANLEGRDCQMVVVADDCALPRSKGITGARGVAGTVLVHKVAGAAAARGKSLGEVAALAQEASLRMGTLGVALDAVTVPGAATKNDRLTEGDGKMELGLGIHGEAGMKQSPLLTAKDLAKEMLATIVNYGRMDEIEENKIIPMVQAGDQVCLLVNNLGGTSNFEMSILAGAAVKELESTYQCKVTRLLVGSYMTSFDMHGASLTLLNLTGASSDLVECLDAATEAPAWAPCQVLVDAARPSATELAGVASTKAEVAVNLPPLASHLWNAEKVQRLLAAAAKALQEAEPLLTKYDTIVGDGDCGITMKRGATHILESNLPTDHPVTMFGELSKAVSASMGGTSGVLLELFFLKLSSTLQRNEEITLESLCVAFQAGVDAVSLYGGAQVGSRTMLDALVPSAKVLVETQNLAAAAQTARTGADGTAEMTTASAGRSNYLSEDTLTGTPDPGAVAVAIVLEALAKGE